MDLGLEERTSETKTGTGDCPDASNGRATIEPRPKLQERRHRQRGVCQGPPLPSYRMRTQPSQSPLTHCSQRRLRNVQQQPMRRPAAVPTQQLRFVRPGSCSEYQLWTKALRVAGWRHRRWPMYALLAAAWPQRNPRCSCLKPMCLERVMGSRRSVPAFC